MEAQQVDELPRDKGWQLSRNGTAFAAWRATAPRSSDGPVGQEPGPPFPRSLRGPRRPAGTAFHLDGELVIPVGKALSFDALQMRLHPAASRIASSPPRRRRF